MNPITIFFGLVLLAIAVFFVASPLRFKEPKMKKTVRTTPPGSLVEFPEQKRQAVLLALRDLDFDYQTGKVAEEDYQTLRANLVKEAAAMMQSQERQKEDAIEALIQSRRKARTASQPAARGKPKGAHPSAEKQCHHCQTPLKEGAKFCSKCGSPVAGATCPSCKQPLQPGDRFCPACGLAVGQEEETNQPAAQPEGE